MLVGQFADGYAPIADGVTGVIRNYAYWMNKKYCRCVVCAPSAPDYSEEDAFTVLRFLSLSLPGRAPYRLGLPALDMRFKRDVEKLPLDIIHAHAPFGAGMAALRLGKRLGIPVVASFHSKYYDDFLQYTHSKALSEAAIKHVVRFYQSAQSVWSVSEASAQTLRSYGFGGEITVVPNGTDLIMPPDAPAARRRAESLCGLAPGQRMFLYVGQLTRQKNTQLIIRAAAEYKKADPSFKLVLAGEGCAKAELSSMAHKAGLAGNAVFLGTVRSRDALAALYLRASALLFPSAYDNAPLVLREAASLCCPAVLLRGSNAAEGVFDGYNGYLCENSVPGLLDAMRRIGSLPYEAGHIGQNARATLAKSWEDIVGMVYGKYGDILSKKA